MLTVNSAIVSLIRDGYENNNERAWNLRALRYALLLSSSLWELMEMFPGKVGWLVYFILLRHNEQALLPSCLDKWIVQALTKRRRKERNIT